ncbi:transmembrane protein 272-like [Archocentrus centrarchus]|uniref:transmembrane protein 272-like n=1 Tax=Archocentrus centrarchus TaxID=63155 RepID=UPI0011E9F4E1|nr:transmembrane protein 272-like [Archocentrus centrarchus]
MLRTNLMGRIQNPPQPPASALGISKVLTAILPIAQIAVGAKYLDQCPQQHYIPIYLIVVGVFSLIVALLACLPCAKEREDGTSNPLSWICRTWNSLISFFIFCWFIAGNVWIYSIYEPNYEKNTTHPVPYCNKTLYLFAFWTTTLAYILLGVFFVCGCLVLICACLCGIADPDDNV